jgi:hypothetical protein
MPKKSMRHKKRSLSRSRKIKKIKMRSRSKSLSKSRKLRIKKGGGIFPSAISQIGYSITGTGQSIIDGWNGKPSSFAYVNSSPEVQRTMDDGYYKSHHNTI